MNKSIMTLLLAGLPLLCAAHAKEEIIKDVQGMDCFVYLPETIDPAVTYQLLVGVHGAGGRGNGAAGLKDWAKRGDVIVIGPSFETKGERPYQNGDGIHADKLISLFGTLKKSHKLKDRMFLHGFSGGSQFVHRFTMLHPKLVCGVSAHSGGTWATDNYGRMDKAAKDIPFAISCGEKDTGKAFPEAPFNRLEWYDRFRQELDKEKFRYIGATWPDVGHSISSGAWDLMRQCFQIATGLPGLSEKDSITISPDWKNLDQKNLANSPVADVRQPAMPDANWEKLIQAAFKKADAEIIPDQSLVGFMTKHPPGLWKDKPGSGNLLAQCERAAKAWHAASIEKGMWNNETRRQFSKFAAGLDIRTEP